MARYNQTFGPSSLSALAPSSGPRFEDSFEGLKGRIMGMYDHAAAGYDPNAPQEGGHLVRTNLTNTPDVANDPNSTFNTNPDVPGNVERVQKLNPGTARDAVIGGLRRLSLQGLQS